MRKMLAPVPFIFVPSWYVDPPSGARCSPSAIHSASIPSNPRTCHQRSPPTTFSSSSGPNHSMRWSAASLQVFNGISTGQTVAHGGAGTCVFVLDSIRCKLQRGGQDWRAYKDCNDSTVFLVPRAINAAEDVINLAQKVSLTNILQCGKPYDNHSDT